MASEKLYRNTLKRGIFKRHFACDRDSGIDNAEILKQ